MVVGGVEGREGLQCCSVTTCNTRINRPFNIVYAFLLEWVVPHRIYEYNSIIFTSHFVCSLSCTTGYTGPWSSFIVHGSTKEAGGYGDTFGQVAGNK